MFALMRSQKNQVLALLSEAGLNPLEFEWERTQSGWSPTEGAERLVHSPTGFFWEFHRMGTGHATIHSPGGQAIREEANLGTWEYTLGRVQDWTVWLKRELEAPDLWGQLEDQRKMLGAGEIGDAPPNTPFDATEREQIARGLREIKEYLEATYELSAAQQQAIETRLRYLEDAASRVGRLDWRNILVAALFQIILQAALGSEAFQAVISIAEATLRGLFDPTSGVPMIDPGSGGHPDAA